MKLIEYYFLQLYGDESSSKIERVKKLCYDLVKEYKPNDGNETHFDFSLRASEFDMDIDESVDPLAGYDLYVSNTCNVDT